MSTTGLKVQTEGAAISVSRIVVV